MATLENFLTKYENWMERRPTQALIVHLGAYLVVTALVIGLGLSISS